MLPPWGSVGWFIVAPSGQILKPCLWQALCALAVAAAIAPPCELMLEAALALIAASTERRETIATAASIMVGGLRESAVAEASGHGTRRSAQFGRGRLDGIRERTSGAEQRGQEADRGGQHAAWWSSDLTGAWEALHSLQYTVDGQNWSSRPGASQRSRVSLDCVCVCVCVCVYCMHALRCLTSHVRGDRPVRGGREVNGRQPASRGSQSSAAVGD
jgi:hypothetical protein